MQKQHKMSLSYVAVVDSEHRRSFNIPAELVSHHPKKKTGNITWCRNYVANDPNSCPCQNRCRFAHIDVASRETLNFHTVHVNYVWTSLNDNIYSTMPNSEEYVMRSSKDMSFFSHYFRVPGERCLRTKGAIETPDSLHYCVPFEIDGMCLAGEECMAAHILNLDTSEIKMYRRSPPIPFSVLMKEFQRQKTK